MPSEPENRNKNKQNRFQNFSQALIPWIALLFTIVFGVMELRSQAAIRQLTASNVELAISQVKVSLIPSLSSKDASQRAMALYLAQALDEQFAVEIASVLAKSDPDKSVRISARSTLGSLSKSRRNDVKQIAEKGIDQYDIMIELRTKGLLNKLNAAQDYIDGGSRNGYEKALKLYREVVGQLSPGVLRNLDQNLLADAKRSDEEGYIDQSARNYRSLFSDYR
ncbi:MAG: hypothetical protein IMF18_03380 [Proteobacteria bacterium]|nr:hypothetical protein [Pseudomonadota bacterium]